MIDYNKINETELTLYINCIDFIEEIVESYYTKMYADVDLRDDIIIEAFNDLKQHIKPIQYTDVDRKTQHSFKDRVVSDGYESYVEPTYYNDLYYHEFTAFEFDKKGKEIFQKSLVAHTGFEFKVKSVIFDTLFHYNNLTYNNDKVEIPQDIETFQCEVFVILNTRFSSQKELNRLKIENYDKYCWLMKFAELEQLVGNDENK